MQRRRPVIPSLGCCYWNAYSAVTGYRHLPKRLSACHLTHAYRSIQLDAHGGRVVYRTITGVRGVRTNTAAGWAADGNSTKFRFLHAAASVAEIGASNWVSIFGIAFDFRSPACDSNCSSFVRASCCGPRSTLLPHTMNSTSGPAQKTAPIWPLRRAEACP